MGSNALSHALPRHLNASLPATNFTRCRTLHPLAETTSMQHCLHRQAQNPDTTRSWEPMTIPCDDTPAIVRRAKATTTGCLAALRGQRETALSACSRNLRAALWCAIMLVAGQATAGAAESIIVQSTTSTQNAGFYRHVLPTFTAETGITVKVVAVGTGQALKNAQNCDGDMLIVHARAAEDAFIAAGYGAARFDPVSYTHLTLPTILLV